MTLRSGHGNGKGVPRVEVMPADELPAGVPGGARAESPSDRGAGGKFAPGNSLARLGGESRRGHTRLASRLGLRTLGDDAPFRPYKASATSFRIAHCSELARTVGGGVCGPGPSSLVASASLQLAWSRYLSDLAAETNDVEAAVELAMKASRLSEASRQNLLAAHELCAKEAQARPRAPVDPLAAWRAPLPPKEPNE